LLNKKTDKKCEHFSAHSKSTVLILGPYIYFYIRPDSEPAKLLDHYKQKTRRGGGLSRKIPAAKSLYRSSF
jgi:hypothetical protein